MKSDDEKWHYLALKKRPSLLRRITSKHNDGFCCLNCLHWFKTEIKLKSHAKIWTKKKQQKNPMISVIL